MEKSPQEKPKEISSERKKELKKIGEEITRKDITPEFREAVKEKRWPTPKQIIEDVHLKAETELLEGTAPIEKSRTKKEKAKKPASDLETYHKQYQQLSAIEKKLVSEFDKLRKHQKIISSDKKLAPLEIDREFTEGSWGLDNIDKLLIRLYNQEKERGDEEEMKTIASFINKSLEIKIFLLQEEIARLKEQLKKEE